MLSFQMSRNKWLFTSLLYSLMTKQTPLNRDPCIPNSQSSLVSHFQRVPADYLLIGFSFHTRRYYILLSIIEIKKAGIYNFVGNSCFNLYWAFLGSDFDQWKVSYKKLLYRTSMLRTYGWRYLSWTLKKQIHVLFSIFDTLPIPEFP